MDTPSFAAAEIEALVLDTTGGAAITNVVAVQELWSGYGKILRFHLEGASLPSVIVKRVRFPDAHDHPRGWNSDRSHERKVRSYHVELAWYERYAKRCPTAARVPLPLALERTDDGVIMVLEDLDAAGFARRINNIDAAELDACLSWLANFHATFLGERPDDLWPTGTYWHLETRPDEFDALDDGPLKDGAAAIDQMLTASQFQTFVHGDAKLANFCFQTNGDAVAAVDFQYVGAGCGMKDVAYFISSCLDEDDCEAMEHELLDRYFDLLAAGLEQLGKSVDFAGLELEWRTLYPVAWTDFTRFLRGWSPGHWKLHRYGERLVNETLNSL